MISVKPVYLVILAAVILFVVYIKISNPYREYSTAEFWEEATIASVLEIPDEALSRGNRNGPVLMWAAIGSRDTAVLKALVDRGSDINESDGVFKGTPLTGAAGYSRHPEIIEELIDLGADINKRVHNGETALMIAARYNKNHGIVTVLVKHGAKLDDKNKQGNTALALAKHINNETAIEELESFKN